MSAGNLRSSRITAVVALACASLVALTGCGSPPSDGEQRARDYTERIAIGMADDATRGRTVVDIPAEALAAGMVNDYRTPNGPGVRPDSFTVEAVEWGGKSSWVEPAFVVVRITADVDEGVEESGGGWFVRSTLLPGGRATECYVITLPVSGGDRGARVDQQSCLNTTTESTPRPIGSFELPDDAFERMREFLASERPLDEAAQLFDPSITVDARIVEGMRVIAARGSEPQDCIVAARLPSGEITRVTLSPEQKMPGEIGCSASAVLLLSPSETG